MKKKKSITIALILIFFVGLALLLYPTVSDYWNSFTQSKVIAEYTETVAEMDGERYDGMICAAQEYNRALSEGEQDFYLDEHRTAEYEELLDLSEMGVMGYVEIPSIDCVLPIYHGTEESVLQIAIGHLEWTSLPVGGEGSHCVISGHRGLPSARLFTDLDKLTAGDVFLLRVLHETFTYEVDQILIVEPQETEELMIREGEDLCTLMTCTPYGVNSHRLLVRGHRVENAAETEEVRVTADAILTEPLLVAVMIAVPVIVILLVILLAFPRRSGKAHKGDNDERS